MTYAPGTASRILLLFNANQVYDRQILKGIGDFLQTHSVNWNMYISDNLRWDAHDHSILNCDGMIANYDDHHIETIARNSSCPIIGVGASFHDKAEYPSIPYVASDNYALIKAAYDHLCSKGIKQFALYSYPASRHARFAYEREVAFQQIMQKHHHAISIYQGIEMSLTNWQEGLENLADWVSSLPKNTGIIAVNDARARHILQACKQLNKKIPDECCLIGIDNEEVINYLSNNYISTITQGTEDMGYQAASLLQQMLENKHVPVTQTLIPPKQIVERQSTDYRSIEDPYVIQAMHYIRQHACKNIKVEHVTSAVKISRSNLELRFKQDLNLTIHTIIYAEKLKQAKYLLTHTTIPLPKIAEQCGYPSLQYFYFLFNKEFKQTPKQYREEHSYYWSEISY